MTDIEKLVDLAESLIPKMTMDADGLKWIGMNVTDRFTGIPTNEELLQVTDAVNDVFQLKRPDYVASCWRRNCWNNLERQYHWCVWLTVTKYNKEVAE